MSFPDFLSYLQTGVGINAAIGILVSLLVEYWPWYGELDPKVKRLLVMAFSFTLPLIAATVGAACAYVPWAFEITYWPALVAGFTAFFAGQVVHTRALKSR